MHLNDHLLSIATRVLDMIITLDDFRINGHFVHPNSNILQHDSNQLI